MTTPINHYSFSSHLWITLPHSLIQISKKAPPNIQKIQEMFLGHTTKLLDNQKTSFFFVIPLSNEIYYPLCRTITIIAFGALGITACLTTLAWSPHYLLTTLILFAIIDYKFVPLFTTTLEERFFEAAHIKNTLKLLLKKEQQLLSLTKKELDSKLESLKISPKNYYKEMYKLPSLKNHPDRERVCSIILIYILARFEYLQETQKSSMKTLKIWQKALLKTHKILEMHDKAIKILSFQEHSELEETAEKLSAMIYELYEFDILSEKQTSLLSDSIKAAYLLHLIKDPLHCPSYLSIGEVLPKQSFEREALGKIPSAQSFFVTKNNRYISKKFLVEHFQNIPDIETHLFSGK